MCLNSDVDSQALFIQISEFNDDTLLLVDYSWYTSIRMFGWQVGFFAMHVQACLLAWIYFGLRNPHESQRRNYKNGFCT